MTITRIPVKDLKRKLETDPEYLDDPWQNHYRIGLERLKAYRRLTDGFYRINRRVARKLWGKPDCLFQGEWMYAVYHMEARQGDVVQRFLLWADPVSAGKGCGMGLLGRVNRKMIPGILQALSDLNPQRGEQQGRRVSM